MLREGSPPTMCHLSHVTGHMSYVRSPVSGVTCQVSHVRCGFFYVFFLHSVGAIRWKVCYQQGLPCLVLCTCKHNIFIVIDRPGTAWPVKKTLLLLIH